MLDVAVIATAFFWRSTSACSHDRVVHVACIGDSITEGDTSGIQATYPTILNEVVGSLYVVTNYGVGGRTAQSDTGDAYIDTDKYQSAIKSEADVYVAMLGTNDAKLRLWNEASYVVHLTTLLDRFAALPSEPTIMLLSPPPYIIEENKWGPIETSPINVRLQSLVEQVAAERGILFVDVHARFLEEGISRDLATFYEQGDGIHPNQDGNRLIAEAVALGLVKTPSPTASVMCLPTTLMATRVQVPTSGHIPTYAPTHRPTYSPSRRPKHEQTHAPMNMPIRPLTQMPTPNPTLVPAQLPMYAPTHLATHIPTPTPTLRPTRLPTHAPTHLATHMPTPTPTLRPTRLPTHAPTHLATHMPTPTPTLRPTRLPTHAPTHLATHMPTPTPTLMLTRLPTHAPARLPTHHVPTQLPRSFPTPASSHLPARITTRPPSEIPTPKPTTLPKRTPTHKLPFMPTQTPAKLPMASPLLPPSHMPTQIPTVTTRVNLPSAVARSSFPTHRTSNVPIHVTSHPPTAMHALSSSPTPVPSNVPTILSSTFPTQASWREPSLALWQTPSVWPTLQQTGCSTTTSLFSVHAPTPSASSKTSATWPSLPSSSPLPRRAIMVFNGIGAGDIGEAEIEAFEAAVDSICSIYWVVVQGVKRRRRRLEDISHASDTSFASAELAFTFTGDADQLQNAMADGSLIGRIRASGTQLSRTHSVKLILGKRPRASAQESGKGIFQLDLLIVLPVVGAGFAVVIAAAFLIYLLGYPRITGNQCLIASC